MVSDSGRIGPVTHSESGDCFSTYDHDLGNRVAGGVGQAEVDLGHTTGGGRGRSRSMQGDAGPAVHFVYHFDFLEPHGGTDSGAEGFGHRFLGGEPGGQAF